MPSPYADDDRLYPAPRNSLGGPPPGIPHKGDGRIGDGRLVVVWLDWGRRVELVPATVDAARRTPGRTKGARSPDR